MITFVLCNIFEQIWYSESILTTDMIIPVSIAMNIIADFLKNLRPWPWLRHHQDLYFYSLIRITTLIIAKVLLQSSNVLGCFKSAKNFICQKVQHFQADSESLGKINTKKNSNFFSMFSFAYLTLVVANAIVSKQFYCRAGVPEKGSPPSPRNGFDFIDHCDFVTGV